MDASFWHERWETGRIAFHEGAPNTLLTENFGKLGLRRARVFAPLCGKSEDLAWLAGQGHIVCGAELDRRAVEAFFDEHGLAPEITEVGALRRYSAGAVTLFQGDIFALDAATLGPVDLIFDRAALVALPPAMRPGYTAHLRDITAGAPQFLITFEYDQTAMDGPPFSVLPDEVTRHYAATHDVTELARRAIAGPLQKRTTGEETAWHIIPR